MQRVVRVLAAVALVASFVGIVPVPRASAVAPATGGFLRTWERTDKPVAETRVSRTWMWGPEAAFDPLWEPYIEAPGGQRLVQYFDKSRMEDASYINSSAPWDVTNGLLARELMTGNLQIGDNTFEHYDPAPLNVAGDLDDETSVTYASFNGLMGNAPIPSGWVITQTVDANGVVMDGGALGQLLAEYGVTAQAVGAPTNHTVASVFWEFMNSQGMVYQNGQYTTAPLFENAFYATGYPLTEAYWTIVPVGGVSTRVLVQVFERRVLTYTPSNPEGWKVEAGNVGLHYTAWRYGLLGKTPIFAGEQQPTPDYQTIGDGTFRVGIDIQPGIYRNSDSSGGCSWNRLSDFSGELNDIIANDFTDDRTIVEIKPTDAGFSSENCGIWTDELTPITASPTSAFPDGTYLVGEEVAPGLWRNSDSSKACYWERLSGFGGELSDIEAKGYSSAIQTVRIQASDTGFHANDCGTWTRIGD